jgi:tetratricopeptide (TPR) repeat protein
MSRTSTDPFDQALALYGGGDFERCRELALEALRDDPRNAGLLRLAGRASLELDLPDAIPYLQQATDLEPGNPDAWRELGDALLAEGRIEPAVDAIRRAVDLRPTDVAALIDLAHAVYAVGQVDTAIALVEDALRQKPGDLAALRSLVDMCPGARETEKALRAARTIVQLEPADVLAAIDVAELSLALDRLDDAADAFRWLRDVDDEPDHEVLAYHGLIETEVRRERWRSALDLAVDATRVDRYGRTTDVLAYVVSQVFGAGDRPAPDRRDVDDALAASRAEHRRLHAALVL